MRIEDLASRKNLFAIMLGIGTTQIAGYYLAGMLGSPDGGMGVPQPDTLLYCQAARRVAEGHPLSYSSGTAMSTGTTSVLYPFILAIPYVLGTTGDALLTAGFVLNAIFYLVFLFGWCIATWNWASTPLVRLTAALLISTAAQPAFCAMAQSDIGIWLAASGLLAAGLSTFRPGLYGPVLILAPWIRPEGMVCVIAFAMVVALVVILRRLDFLNIAQEARDNQSNYLSPSSNFAILSLALASMIGVFVFNFVLTGHAQFSSVAHKGYFKLLPFAAAVNKTATDTILMMKELFLGLPKSMPRDCFSFPLLSGACFLTGLLSFRWKSSRRLGFWIMSLAAFGGFLTVAQSGWQNSNLDRYLAWIMPITLLFVAEGICRVEERLSGYLLKFLPTILLTIFSVGTIVLLWCTYNLACTKTTVSYLFAKECEQVMPRGKSVGAWSTCNLAYAMSDRRFAHVCGIYSPEFFLDGGAPEQLELLAHNKSLRFDYWISDLETSTSDPNTRLDNISRAAIAGPNGFQLRDAEWYAFDNSQISPLVPGVQLIEEIDVAYVQDEFRTNYEVIDRYGRPPLPTFVQFGKLGKKNIIESGRVLIGGDSFTLYLKPHNDATVIMRTMASRSLAEKDIFSSGSQEYSFANPLSLKITVDDEVVPSVTVSYATNNFSDVSFTIPGTAIKKSPVRIALLGDHIAFHYWFFQ